MQVQSLSPTPGSDKTEGRIVKTFYPQVISAILGATSWHNFFLWSTLFNVFIFKRQFSSANRSFLYNMPFYNPSLHHCALGYSPVTCAATPENFLAIFPAPSYPCPRQKLQRKVLYTLHDLLGNGFPGYTLVTGNKTGEYFAYLGVGFDIAQSKKHLLDIPYIGCLVCWYREIFGILPYSRHGNEIQEIAT